MQKWKVLTKYKIRRLVDKPFTRYTVYSDTIRCDSGWV